MGVVESVAIISDLHAERHSAWRLRLPSSSESTNALGPVCAYAVFPSPES